MGPSCHSIALVTPPLLALVAVCLATAASGDDGPAGARRSTDTLSATDFLPDGFVADGSLSYRAGLQAAINEGAKSGRPVVFPRMVYLLEDESGLTVPSHSTLFLHGAVFRFDENRTRDGQAFLCDDVTDVQFVGGEIAGRNDAWPDGVNIRGIHITGPSSRIGIRGMYIHDLSSNGVGVFGVSDDQPAHDIWIIDTIIDNCCNKYGDYQAPRGEPRGPEKGSVREDQGLCAMYFVRDFLVRGCRLQDSRSDGTHFYRCRAGQFVDNKVYRAKMGGYFVETCEQVLAANNIIRDNGSRGVTIERGSRYCTLRGNTVENSGREGLWMPDSVACVVTGNLLIRNGRKPNGKAPHAIWNANITINESPVDPSNTSPGDCLIANNMIDTTADQIAAIRVDVTEATSGIVIENNVLCGEKRSILLQGTGRQNVVVHQNHGHRTPDEQQPR
jgi:parallel beta-helix repeat protein